MRTRDTVLIAVLINVGLLAILFATARGTESSEEMVAAAVPLMSEAPEEIVEPKVVGPDEIDQALEQYRIATQVEPAVQEETAVEITVKRGDTLEKIARANGTSVDRLMKANGLSSTKLQIGQRLEIPGDVIAAAEEPAKPQVVEAKEYYTVESGDSPWLIAKRVRIPLDDLLRLNNLDESSAKRLKPGDRIRIK